ncbi:hypothetical protein [Lewinella sp. 4G2]|uniref:hypothetical protein n=1 Tax=Lewinella sp. 4G2 TaxID=1803372 RepID=UPI0007B4A552|nr:hypothetical protein [Lewinella sp. 4G2]OAV44608.1 hypothetical protein A3850_008935 [Lewinella sp. 4G2]
MNNRKTRYRFYSPQGIPPFALETKPADKTPTTTPQQTNTTGQDGSGDDLQNVDQSQGGYGGGSGFAPDRT